MRCCLDAKCISTHRKISFSLFIESDIAMLHNYNIKIHPDVTGVEIIVPGLVDSSGTVVMSLVRYQLHLFMKRTSQAKLQKVRESVRLYYEYSATNIPEGFGTGQVGYVDDVRYWEHFRNFRHAIAMGTFSSEGLDPSGLNWFANGSKKADSVIFLLTEFFIWLDELDGADRASRYNPLLTPTRYEVISAAAAYEYKRNRALLGHTWSWSSAASEKRMMAGRQKGAPPTEAMRISDNEFYRLLHHGFDTRTEVGLRDTAISILLNKGGVRSSEAIGAWVIDVMDDPANRGCAHIRLQHPTEAQVRLIHKGKTYIRRVDYLREVHGLSDRISLPVSDRQHLGWKSPFNVLAVYWAEPWWSKVFWHLYCAYLRLTAIKRGDHPYLFIDSDSGLPLAYDTFAKSYERAVYRAGLVPLGHCTLKKSGC